MLEKDGLTAEERMQLLEIVATNSLTPFYAVNRMKMEDDWNENPEKYESILQEAVNRLYQKVRDKQQKGIKDKISYIVISFLRSSILTGSYELSISACNELLYFDEVETEIYFNASFILNYIDEDMEFYRNYIKEHIEPLDETEYQHIRNIYAGDYLKVAEAFMKRFAYVFEENPLFEQIAHEDTVTVMFSGYHDKGILVYQTGEAVTV